MKTRSNQPIPVLIVDDDPVFAQLVRQLVLNLDIELPCTPHWVDSAESALEELNRRTYELVLLDYHLPGADGLQMLAQIREMPAERQPAVIMLTASGNESVAVEAMKRGAKDYLSKNDLDLPPLTRALKSALAQKQLAAQVARYNAEITADLELARRLQQSLLPLSYPRFPLPNHPRDSALHFCHRYFANHQLSGDFFTVLPLSDTQAGVFICDVMGHGVRSALVTSMLRAMVDEFAPAANHPGHFLSEVNRKFLHLFKQTDGLMFATACYLVADVEAGTLHYANAGHPFPLHVQRAQDKIVTLSNPEGSQPALGIFPEVAYQTACQPLAAQDLLLLFTDGLFEVMNTAGTEDYGKARLLETVRQRMHHPMEELLDEVIADVQTYAAVREFEDDVCLLGMEVTAVAEAECLVAS